MREVRRGFIRTLWGDESIPRSQTKIRNDVRAAVAREQFVDCIDYVFGDANCRFLESCGLNPIRLDSRGVVWEGGYFWRHKLDAWHRALNDFDEIVFVDWDVRMTGPLPSDFWDRLSQKAELQACLVQYRSVMAPWRTNDIRKVPSAAFVYIRGIAVATRLNELWNAEAYRTEQICMAKYTDDALGGWRGVDAYCKDFEPVVCRLRRRSAMPAEINDDKPVCFWIY